MLDPYTYRCPAGHPIRAWSAPVRPTEEILEYEGHTVAAVILETVTGTNGVIRLRTATCSRSARPVTGTASS